MIKAYYSQEACTKWGSAIFLIDGKEVEVTAITQEGEYKWLDAVDLGAVGEYRFLRSEQIGFYQAEEDYYDLLQASDYEDDLNHLDDAYDDDAYDSEEDVLSVQGYERTTNIKLLSNEVIAVGKEWLGYRLHHNMN